MNREHRVMTVSQPGTAEEHRTISPTEITHHCTTPDQQQNMTFAHQHVRNVNTTPEDSRVAASSNAKL
ncbi:hypothetical protein E2C01_055619 [Portunus trituberculatus]|uniref:Uncharacterized protein n=1 Tax=Portunus trituberculatus TaxID=210409 RepID=A0A5B7GVA2_PORTR|nr:hypothetical protein [Portunus trituberculatus]